MDDVPSSSLDASSAAFVTCTSCIGLTGEVERGDKYKGLGEAERFRRADLNGGLVMDPEGLNGGKPFAIGLEARFGSDVEDAEIVLKRRRSTSSTEADANGERLTAETTGLFVGETRECDTRT